MAVLIDTDAVSHRSNQPEFGADVELLGKSGAFLTVPVTIVEEIIRTSDASIRAKLSSSLVDLLDDRPLLAHLWDQITWGSQRFLSGEIAFRPFTAIGTNILKMELRKGSLLRPGALEELHKRKRRMLIRGTQCMHKLECIADATERRLLRPRWQEYIAWNPVCRTFLELFLLAIRRLAIEPPAKSSKKGPKWADYLYRCFRRDRGLPHHG